MQCELESLVSRFEKGAITRRELIARLPALCVVPAAAIALAAPQKQEHIGVAGLDHLASRVTDLARSKRFYMEHLNFAVRSESKDGVFLEAGQNWIALFNESALTTGIPRESRPGVDHFAFRSTSPGGFDATMAALRARNLNPVSPGNTRRIYFRDPDGIVVQLSYEAMS